MNIIKFTLVTVFYIILSKSYSKEYILKGYGVSNLKTIEVSENFKFSSYRSEGMWDDSNGDYGNEKCAGYVKQKNNKVELEVICENINQNNEIFWNSRIRKSEKGGGVGQITFLNGTGKYNKMIGLICPYGINYKKNYAWIKAKCKIDE